MFFARLQRLKSQIKLQHKRCRFYREISVKPAIFYARIVASCLEQVSHRLSFMLLHLLRASFAPCHTYSFLPFRSKSKTCQEQVSPWQSKMHFMLFSHGTCWGFRSPIPRITLRLSPRFLPAALTVLISQSKEKCLSAPKNKQTGQPKPTRIEAHSLEARMIDNTTSFAAFRL